MSQQAGSSSSSFTYKWNYDVFLNFRGTDTRHGFTSNLYNSLCQKGIHTFIDDEGLRRGEEITPALLRAIQNSRIAIIVFSKNYASSTFCLDELVKILGCLKEEEGRLVFPIFYDVDPSQVRYQTETFSEALAKHEERFKDNNDKVKKWKKALYEAANLSGWHFQQGSQPEYKFIQNIVKEVSRKINSIPLHVADNPIGLEDAVLEVKSLLGHESDINMIGIYGIGGIGKTTIARAVYNLIFSQFEGICFLPDIREKAINKHGLVQLQQILLSEILEEKHFKVRDVNRGIPLIKRRLKKKKVLLILDDVDELEQLKVLAGEYGWFGSGSVIIITTRDKHLLATHGVVKLYEVKPLNDEKALQLFNWHAFKNAKANPSFIKISNRAISYARGIPLALEVIGSHLFGKSLNECSSALDKYESIPHKKIHEMLKVSYDGLGENEKEILLDIACFFHTYEVSYVIRMLHARGFHPEDGLRVLVDRSLIKIDAYGFVRMHDLIRDMGREIVRQESVLEPGRRSRLWIDEDIVHVLEENTGTGKIEFIKLDGYKNNIQVQWNGKAFKKTKNLKILIIRNTTFSTGPKHLPNSLKVLDWSCYPSSSLPFDFNPKQVEILHMPRSCLKIFQPHQMLKSLSIINFERCKFLTELPSLREVPCLTDLCLDWCTNLVKIDGSIGFLDQLRKLSVYGCTELKILAPYIKLTSLEILDLQMCSSLESFPEVLEKMEKIRKVYVDETSIETLPHSIGNLVGVELLSLQECKRLHQLPLSIYKLPKVGVRLSDRPWTGYRIFEENQDEEMSSLEVSPMAMLISDYYYPKDITYLDVYYQYLSPNNVIQVCSPNPLMHFDLNLLFNDLDRRKKLWYPKCQKSSMSFFFRNKFPKITLCCSIRLNTWESENIKLLTFKLSVLINGTRQLSSLCNYLYDKWSVILECDLQCKAEKGIFSEQEWNEAEILFELKFPTTKTSYEASWETSGSLHWSLIGVSKEGNNKDDIEFKNPMSTFTFPNRESSSTLPNCLYYDFSYGAK